jgi:hypothetical protein
MLLEHDLQPPQVATSLILKNSAKLRVNSVTRTFAMSNKMFFFVIEKKWGVDKIRPLLGLESPSQMLDPTPNHHSKLNSSLGQEPALRRWLIGDEALRRNR